MSGSLIVAAIPLLGYIISYCYEIGYADVFKIPREFISISTTSVLNATGGLITVMIFAFFLLGGLRMAYFSISGIFRNGSKRNYKEVIIRIIIALLIIALLLFIFHAYWFQLLPFVLNIVASILFAIFLLIIQKVFDLVALKSPNEVAKSQPILDNLSGSIVKAGIIFVGVLLILLPVSYLTGQSQATNKEDFLIRGSPPTENVVLRTYGDNLICAPLDRRNRVVKPNFFIIKVNSDTIKLKLMTVGRLHTAQLERLPY